MLCMLCSRSKFWDWTMGEGNRGHELCPFVKCVTRDCWFANSLLLVLWALVWWASTALFLCSSEVSVVRFTIHWHKHVLWTSEYGRHPGRWPTYTVSSQSLKNRQVVTSNSSELLILEVHLFYQSQTCWEHFCCSTLTCELQKTVRSVPVIIKLIGA